MSIRKSVVILLIGVMIVLGSPAVKAADLSFTPNEAMPVAIPDNNPAGITRTFTVSGVPASVTVTRITITLNLTHTWVGDFRVALTSPDGEIHTLFYDIGDPASPAGNGDSSDLDGAYTMSDFGATTLWDGALGGDSSFVIPAGTYRTTNINVNSATSMNTTFGYPGLPLTDYLLNDEEEKSLSNLPPQLTNGTWTLAISDNGPSDTGTLDVGTTLDVRYFLPIAANASISGQLVTSSGRGVTNATVVVRDSSTSEIRTARSSSFGFFMVDDLPVGRTYVVEVQSKSFQFPAQVVRLDDNVTDLVIQANDEF